jgi:hypothetical protein
MGRAGLRTAKKVEHPAHFRDFFFNYLWFAEILLSLLHGRSL